MIAQSHGFICTSFFFVPFQSLFRCFWLSSWFVLTFVSSHTLASLWFLCWSSNKCIQLPISHLFSVKSNLSSSELFKNQFYSVSPFQTILILVFHSVWQKSIETIHQYAPSLGIIPIVLLVLPSSLQNLTTFPHFYWYQACWTLLSLFQIIVPCDLTPWLCHCSGESDLSIIVVVLWKGSQIMPFYCSKSHRAWLTWLVIFLGVIAKFL